MKALESPFTTEAQSPAAFLRQIFLERKDRNSAYSTRAFARDMGMSQALLSLVLAGKRPLTAKQAARVSVLLDLSQEESQALLEATLISLPPNSKGYKKLQSRRLAKKPLFKNYELERFKAISQWYHVAILDLSTTKNFRNDPTWIADRLEISTVQVRDAIARLIDLGFIEEKDGTLRKSESQIYFVTQKSDAAIRSFHKSMMTKAQLKLDQTSPADFETREISSMTMAVRSDRISEAKQKIQKFQKELAAFLTDGECDEVFQLNVQLFPLTKKEKL